MSVILLAAALLLALIIVAAVLLVVSRPGTAPGQPTDNEAGFPATHPYRAPPADPASRGAPAGDEVSKPASDAVVLELEEQFRGSPSDVTVLARLALAYFGRGELDKAQRSFRSLLLQRLDDAPLTKADVFCYLGMISEKQGDRGKAINMLERAVEHDPSLTRASSLLARLTAERAADVTLHAEPRGR